MFSANIFFSFFVNGLINFMQHEQLTAPIVAQIVRALGSPHLGQVLSFKIFILILQLTIFVVHFY